MTTSAPRHPSLVALEGGINFRDLGGVRTTDGRTIRAAKLFRAGAFHRLSTTDCEYLAGVPVSQVIDYRDVAEAAQRPDILWSGAQYHACPANPIRHQVTADLESAREKKAYDLDAQAFMLELYRCLPFNNPAYRHLVTLLLRPEEGALVQHCAVGKDRTGIGVALVLFALGVDEKTVMEDYLLTDVTLAPFRDELLTSLSQTMSEEEFSGFSYILSVKEMFLATALKSIKEQYGSINRWLATDYGLDDAARYQLQRKYLVD